MANLTTTTIRTADGEVIPVGGFAYFYYATPLDNTAVVKFKAIDGPPEGRGALQQIWGLWTHIDGTGIVMADESRVCSLAHARKMGWLTWSDDELGREAIEQQDRVNRKISEGRRDDE